MLPSSHGQPHCPLVVLSSGAVSYRKQLAAQNSCDASGINVFFGCSASHFARTASESAQFPSASHPATAYARHLSLFAHSS